MNRALPPLTLYVHLPWCIRKCPYCDFNSYERRRDLPETDYVEALLRDLDAEQPLAADRVVDSIFIGGGTPSLFSSEAVRRLLEGIRTRIAQAPECEITLEANPGAAEADRFADYRRAGVNRLSIGVQSLRNDKLRALGRVHDAGEAERAVEFAHAAGFANINVDLMYGLPGDNADGSLADLERALARAPTHLSWYQLTLEPGTAFERRPPALPEDDTIAEIEDSGRRLLAESGFERYEISAYAREGFRCTHNLNYWQFGDYLGIGAGAHGKLTRAGGVAIERRAKLRNPQSYMAAAGSARAVHIERIETPDALLTEFRMNALRLVDGVASVLLPERTGRPLADLGAGLDEARQRGWLSADPERLRATPTGLRFLNPLLSLLHT